VQKKIVVLQRLLAAAGRRESSFVSKKTVPFAADCGEQTLVTVGLLPLPTKEAALGNDYYL